MIEAEHRLLDHDTDLALEIIAPSEEDLYVEVCRAVVAQMTGGAPLVTNASRDVVIEAGECTDLLFRWVNHVIALAMTEGFLVSRCELVKEGWYIPPRPFGYTPPSGTRITATLWGQLDHSLITTGLESVTQDVFLEWIEGGGARARVVIPFRGDQ